MIAPFGRIRRILPGPKAAARWLLPLAAAMSAYAAAAQELPEVISPLQVDTDINGVNLVTGRIVVQGPVLAAPGASHLRWDGIQNAAPYVTGRAQGTGSDGALVAYSVHTGTGTSEGFRCDGGNCTSVTGTGSTFGGNSFVQAGTGARWNFRHQAHDTLTTAPSGSSLYYVETVTYPGGETLDWTYDRVPGGAGWVYRPTRIESNLGYFIAISYQSDTYPDAGWFAPRAASLFRRADPAIRINRLTYSGDTITESGDTPWDTGDDRVYACTGCTGIETWSGSLTLPGETVPTLLVTPVSATEAVVGTVTRDGLRWTYAYGNLRKDPLAGRYWYDSLTVTGPEGYRRIYAMTLRGAQYRGPDDRERHFDDDALVRLRHRLGFASHPDRLP